MAMSLSSSQISSACRIGISRARGCKRASAIAAVEANSIELAIIDAQLPDMSGLQLCRVMKDQNAGLLVLQTSTTAMQPQDIAGLQERADAYLAEPMAAGSSSPGSRIAAASRCRIASRASHS
jgi:CheY-like chemotaxis protein